MAPPRQCARTPETPMNEQLDQNLQHLTQTMQTLSEALLHNNHPVPPPLLAGYRDVGRLVSSHRPPMFAGEEDPVVLEEWVRTFNKTFSVVGCPEERRVELASFYFSHEADLWWVHKGLTYLEEPDFDWTTLKDRMRERFYPAHVRAAMYEDFLYLQQGSSTLVEYHKRFLELARFARILVPIKLAKVEKFVAGLNYEARKALTLARKRNESGGSSNFKKPRPDFQAKTTSSPPQGSNRVGSGDQAKRFACRTCGKEHVGKDCQGNALRCYRCGDRGHKVAVCPQQANQKALPPSSGPGGVLRGSSSRGAAGLDLRVVCL
ncbi:PREDICTED: uncharacterized protein LOC109166982 [Ipomoea nil]|uniref:uncharacterized protein LOC109166982 n=1 Tax=Ipomoea nil TaxID=35883 RepID=UPI000901AC5C|nr:PREDICTED: uncharacterized protein LOC109166982 [Ipomoea nil]